MRKFPLNIILKRFFSLPSITTTVTIDNASLASMENVMLEKDSPRSYSNIDNDNTTFNLHENMTFAMDKTNPFVNYQIRAAMLLQRNPITMRTQTPFEASYENYRELYQYQTSRGLFKLENSNEREGRRMKGESTASTTDRIKKGDADEQNDEAIMEMNIEAQTEIQTLFDNAKKEYEKYDNDLKSLKRKLDRKLYLMIKDDLREEKGKWILPYHLLKDESIPIHLMARKAIEKIINVEKMDFYWIGRAPIGYFTERWTDRVSSPFSQKTFIFKGQILRGHFEFLQDGNAGIDYAWLTKEEILHEYSSGGHCTLHIEHLLSE